jgi:hypothetical protein
MYSEVVWIVEARHAFGVVRPRTSNLGKNLLKSEVHRLS